MWQLDNRTPFAAERTWVRDRDGAELWLVAVRCAFDMGPDGGLAVSPSQPPVVAAPEPMAPMEAATSAEPSLRFESDLVRTKTATDVLVLGHCYAPDGRPITALDAGFRVGPVVKRLRVLGERYWRGGRPSPPEPFLRMPLRWERAFGGPDPETPEASAPRWDDRNPIGTGFARSARAAEGLRLPNLEHPDRLIGHLGDAPEPACTGPIPPHWQPRVGLAGTYDAEWQEQRFPLLPDDFDDRHYQCAPTDQQAPGFLTGGEPVVLINLTPDGERRFSLPRLELGLETFFYNGERRPHDPPRLHSVILEPDLDRLSLVWHSALPCHPLVHKLKQTRIQLQQPLPERAARQAPLAVGDAA